MIAPYFVLITIVCHVNWVNDVCNATVVKKFKHLDDCHKYAYDNKMKSQCVDWTNVQYIYPSDKLKRDER